MTCYKTCIGLNWYAAFISRESQLLSDRWLHQLRPRCGGWPRDLLILVITCARCSLCRMPWRWHHEATISKTRIIHVVQRSGPQTVPPHTFWRLIHCLYIDTNWPTNLRRILFAQFQFRLLRPGTRHAVMSQSNRALSQRAAKLPKLTHFNSARHLLNYTRCSA
jgi:hypothetical protein